MEKNNYKPKTALDAFRAILLITKHLYELLPFLLAVDHVPADVPQRIGLLQGIARDIANDPEFAVDWYEAMELLAGEDISNLNVAELLLLSIDLLQHESIGDVWRAAFSIGLLRERSVQHWVILEGVSDGWSSSTSR